MENAVLLSLQAKWDQPAVPVIAASPALLPPESLPGESLLQAEPSFLAWVQADPPEPPCDHTHLERLVMMNSGNEWLICRKCKTAWVKPPEPGEVKSWEPGGTPEPTPDRKTVGGVSNQTSAGPFGPG